MHWFRVWKSVLQTATYFVIFSGRQFKNFFQINRNRLKYFSFSLLFHSAWIFCVWIHHRNSRVRLTRHPIIWRNWAQFIVAFDWMLQQFRSWSSDWNWKHKKNIRIYTKKKKSTCTRYTMEMFNFRHVRDNEDTVVGDAFVHMWISAIKYNEKKSA